MSLTTRQRQQPRGAPLARLSATPRGTTGFGYPWTDGDILYAADLNAAFMPSTGGAITGPISVNGAVACTSVYASSGLFAISPDFYMERTPEDETWRWVENGLINMSLSPTGILNTRSNIVAGGGLTTGSDIVGGGAITAASTVSCTGIYASTGLFAIAPNYYMQRTPADSTWRWVENGVTTMSLSPAGVLTSTSNVVVGGSLQLNNAHPIQAKDIGGTYHNVLMVDTSNNTQIYPGGSGGAIGLVGNVDISGEAVVSGTTLLNGSMQFSPVPANAANDAAAATAGVPVGGVYRNGSVMMVRVT